MNEARADMWTVPGDLRCITTNGYVKKNGACVMGAGTALQATRLHPGIEYEVGKRITEGGNHVHLIETPKGHLATFPVKHTWWEDADPILIRRSADELVKLVDEHGFKRVILPRPGCGNGNLDWLEVAPVLDAVLDNRFLCVDL